MLDADHVLSACFQNPFHCFIQATSLPGGAGVEVDMYNVQMEHVQEVSRKAVLLHPPIFPEFFFFPPSKLYVTGRTS